MTKSLEERFRRAIETGDVGTLLVLLHEPETQFVSRETLADAARIDQQVKAAVVRHPRAPRDLREDVLLSDVTAIVAKDIAEQYQFDALRWVMLRALTERISAPLILKDFLLAMDYAESLLKHFPPDQWSEKAERYY